LLDSDLKDTVDTWNRKNRRIGYVVYLFVLIFSSVSITSNHPLEKEWLTKFPRGGQTLTLPK